MSNQHIVRDPQATADKVTEQTKPSLSYSNLVAPKPSDLFAQSQKVETQFAQILAKKLEYTG